jgi:hypothetical protein
LSSTKERDIARQLAEREGLDPPAGLLARIKSEIPPTIQLGAAAPGHETRGTRRAGEVRQRWLLAASLVAMVGAGLLARHVLEQAPPPAPAVASRPRPQPGADSGLSGPAGRLEAELRRGDPAAAPRVPPPPKPVLQTVPMEAAGGVAGTVEGGVAGGVVGGAPVPAAPAAKAVAAQPVQAPEPREEEKITVTAESPRVDPRKASPPGESKPEYKDFDSFEEMHAAAKPAPPAAPTGAPAPAPDRTADLIPERINVGGNESGQQSAYVGPGVRAAEEGAGKAKERPHPSLAAAAPPPPAAPFRDAAAGRRATYGPLADTGSCDHARREVAAGRLPAPGSVRVGDFLAFLDSGEGGRGRLDQQIPAAASAKPQLLEAQGAPNPFGTARSRLLLFRRRGGAALPAGARMEVDLNPAVVARYREIGAGPGLSALYEVELKADAASGRVATLRLRGLPGGEPEERELALSGLAASWEGASPGFRLAALAAELAESLKGYPWAPADLGALARRIREAAREAPGNPRAAELADLAAAAARLRGNGSP